MVTIQSGRPGIGEEAFLPILKRHNSFLHGWAEPCTNTATDAVSPQTTKSSL